MKYLALSCLLVCSLHSAMANSGKSTLSMLLKKIEEVYKVKISYSPTQTDRIIPVNQLIDYEQNLDRSLAILLDQTGMVFKNQSGFYYLSRRSVPETVIRNTIKQSPERKDTILDYLSVSDYAVRRIPGIEDTAKIIAFEFPVTKYTIPEHHPLWSIRTNMLLLLTGSLNIGTDYAINRQWSIGGDLSYNPWSYGDMRLRHFMIRPEARFWFCQVNNGHYIHAGLQYMRYNIGGFPKSGLFSANIQRNRYQGNNGGVNLGYGYSWLIGKRFNLELELGLGVLYDSYTKYPCTKCGSALSRRNHVYIGPTDVAINLVYILK